MQAWSATRKSMSSKAQKHKTCNIFKAHKTQDSQDTGTQPIHNDKDIFLDMVFSCGGQRAWFWSCLCRGFWLQREAVQLFSWDGRICIMQPGPPLESVGVSSHGVHGSRALTPQSEAVVAFACRFPQVSPFDDYLTEVRSEGPFTRASCNPSGA